MFLTVTQATCARIMRPSSKPPDNVKLARELWVAPDATMRVVQQPGSPPVDHPEESAQFTDGAVEVNLDIWMPFRALPEILRQTADTAALPSGQMVALDPPHTVDLSYKVHSPDGFIADKLPDAEDLKLGPAAFTVSYQAEADTTVTANVRFVLGKASYTSADVQAFREAYLKHGNTLAPVVRFVPAHAQTAPVAGGSRFEEVEGGKKLTDLSPGEFDAACGWTNKLAHARLPAEGTVIDCDGQKIPFNWPNHCAIAGGRPKSGCKVTVAQTRKCMPAVLEQIRRDPCSFFVASSMGEAKDLLAKIPECTGTEACVFAP